MITISVHGRLAYQPELKLTAVGPVCEFRLLSTRFAKGKEEVEAVTFFCYGEMAEDFCSTTVKGQEISATGTQETQRYMPQDGQEKLYVKYRLTWFSRGRKPKSEYASGNQQGESAGASYGQRGGLQSYPPANRGAPLPAARRPGAPDPAGMDGSGEPGFY